MFRLSLLVAASVLVPADGLQTSPGVLAGHLAFLSSDFLGGRGTPSVGLDIAAEYIASQFQAAGLEPVDGSYFQIDEQSRLNVEGTPKCKNVVGVVRGSDPALRDEYLIVSAHYDHVGTKEAEGGGDTIFNGANDDGSGTVGVIETARAVARQKPARSVLFLCFYGEERGLVGSRFYGNNPLVPLKETIGMLNIEMIGRTQKSDGDWSGRLGVTGYDYSDMGARLARSCAKTGVSAVMDPEASGPFFMRSDNAALARVGVPSHTVSVGYIDDKYHKSDDHWDTINYQNMALIVDAIVQSTIDLANDPVPPKWAEIEATKRYREAWSQLHNGGSDNGK